MQQRWHPGDQLIVPSERTDLAREFRRIRSRPDVRHDSPRRECHALAGTDDLERHPDVVEQQPLRQRTPQLPLQRVQGSCDPYGAVPRRLAHAEPALEPPVALIQALGVSGGRDRERARNRAHVRRVEIFHQPLDGAGCHILSHVGKHQRVAGGRRDAAIQRCSLTEPPLHDRYLHPVVVNAAQLRRDAGIG